MHQLTELQARYNSLQTEQHNSLAVSASLAQQRRQEEQLRQQQEQQRQQEEERHRKLHEQLSAPVSAGSGGVCASGHAKAAFRGSGWLQGWDTEAAC